MDDLRDYEIDDFERTYDWVCVSDVVSVLCDMARKLLALETDIDNGEYVSKEDHEQEMGSMVDDVDSMEEEMKEKEQYIKELNRENEKLEERITELEAEKENRGMNPKEGGV